MALTNAERQRRYRQRAAEALRRSKAPDLFPETLMADGATIEDEDDDDDDDDEDDEEQDGDGKKLLLLSYFSGGESLLRCHKEDNPDFLKEIIAAALDEFLASPEPTWLRMMEIMDEAGQSAAHEIFARRCREYQASRPQTPRPPEPEPRKKGRRGIR